MGLPPLKRAKRERRSAGDADAAIILYHKRDSESVGLASEAALLRMRAKNSQAQRAWACLPMTIVATACLFFYLSSISRSAKVNEALTRHPEGMELSSESEAMLHRNRVNTQRCT